jgi:hypothetical protein
MILSRTEALWSIGGGAVGLVASVWWVLSTWQFELTARRAEGTVTELVKLGTPDRYGQAYAPRFEFRTSDGEQQVVDSNIGGSPAGFSVGDRVTVLYRPDDPSHAKIDSVGQLWVLPFAGVTASIVAMVIGFTHM